MEDTPPTKAPTSVDKGNAKMDGTEIAKKSSKSEQKEASSEDDNGESKGEEFGDDRLLAGDDSCGVLEMFRKWPANGSYLQEPKYTQYFMLAV
ncbi:hypothetical protein ACFX10_007628 [Malus domestica]